MSETRILYRLERRCDPCHDGDHRACERTIYASPAAPHVPCECDHGNVAVPRPCRCREVPVRTHINPDLICCDDQLHPQFRRLEATAGHAGGLSTLIRHTRAHFAAISPMGHAARWGDKREQGGAA